MFQRHLNLTIEPSPGRPQYRVVVQRKAARLLGVAALWTACYALTACSIVAPLKPDIDEEPTGAIATSGAAKNFTALSSAGKPAAFPATLDTEDQRRAFGALAIALDPQGNGATVRWDNPVSKARGSLTPVGFAYPMDGLICRGFNAQLETSGGSQSARGIACRDKDAEWSLTEYHPAKKI